MDSIYGLQIEQRNVNIFVQVEIEGDSTYVVQVPARNFVGSIRIRFEGTAFNLKVSICN